MTEPRGPNEPDDVGAPDPNDVPPPVSPVVQKPLVVESPWHKRWAPRVLAVLVLVPLLIFSVWAAVTLNIVYERGERYGYVENLSKKGLVCATWEGELAMTNVPGVAPEIFHFSVRDDAVAADIQQSIGKRVALTYEEHRNVPTSCFAKTDHFVTGVRVEEP